MKNVIKVAAILGFMAAAFTFAPNVTISVDAPTAAACPDNNPICGNG